MPYCNPYLSSSCLSVLDNLGLRLVLVIGIVCVCIYDPITALLLAICLVLSIQRLQKLRSQNQNIKNIQNNTDLNNLVTMNNTVSEEKYEYEYEYEYVE